MGIKETKVVGVAGVAGVDIKADKVVEAVEEVAVGTINLQALLLPVPKAMVQLRPRLTTSATLMQEEEVAEMRHSAGKLVCRRVCG